MWLVPICSPGCPFALHTEEEVFWCLSSITAAENLGILVVEVLMVVGKISVARSGCIQFAECVMGEGELGWFVL